MRKAAAFMTIAMLAGCSQGGGDGNGTAAAPGGSGGSGGATAAGVTMQPGQWETRIEVVNAEMPQLPPGVAVPGMQPMTARFCLTPEQAANPSADVLGGGGRGANPAGCTTENYSVSGGRISGTSVCNMGGGTSRTTINGRFTATSYEMTMQSTSDIGGTSTNTEMRVTAQRVGDCPAG